MKIHLFFICLLGLIYSPINAQIINDINKTDGAYPAIKKSVNNGYLSLFSDNSFRPDQTISRKEAAIIINLLIAKIQSQTVSLSTTEIKELDHLAKTFKGTFSELDDELSRLIKKMTSISDEQVSIRHELAEYKLQVNKLEKQNRYLWIGLAITFIFGIAL